MNIPHNTAFRARAMRIAAWPCLLALVLLISACGYGFIADGKTSLPADVRTLALAEIKNPTTDTGIPALVAAGFRDEITKRHALSWVDSRKLADGLVYLEVDRFYITSSVKGEDDNTLQFSANVRLKGQIKRRGTNETLWDSGLVSVSETFDTVSDDIAGREAISLAVRRLVDRMYEGY